MDGTGKPSPGEIADALRERIRTGVLRAGHRMPTQAELADEFGVDRGRVRQALQALRDEGLLSNASKGTPPRVSTPAGGPGGGGSETTVVGLGQRIAKAFEQPRVRIDALCLTSESLMLGLGEPLRLIHQGLLLPDSIDVRVLLPSRSIALAFPAPVAERGDEDPVHQRWLSMRDAQGRVLRHNLLTLARSHDISVNVEFRALPFTPPVRLYLLGDSEALFAYYMITKQEEEVGGERVETYDALGTQSLLFSYESGSGPRDAAFVKESQQWFDALWQTISTDLTLS
ncbi:GntR family transcriptional regulator [Streptomyces tsukubensis]|nr:GntR family transcriptional regulator [Streptomyces tsukubensis]